MSVLLTVSFVIGALAMAAIIVMFVVAARSSKRDADEQSNVLKCTSEKPKALGVVFGMAGKSYCYSPSDSEGHIFVCGGSGSGKTSALLIPTLRNWDSTFFAIDISGDIEKNVDCCHKIVYDPYGSTTVPYNIFAAVDALQSDDEQMSALAEIAALLMPDESGGSANARYFQQGGRDILTAALICGYHQGLDFIQICDKVLSTGFLRLFNWIDDSKDLTAIRHINQFEGALEQNTAGCKQNTDRAISFFLDSQKVKNSIRRPVAGEPCFTCYSVEDHNVFIRVPDARLDVMAPLLKIITSQVLHYLSDRPEKNTTPILLALDEFASLGNLNIDSALQKSRKKHVRIMVLTQSTAAIDRIYNENGRISMMDNFSFKVILSASDPKTQKYFADLIGTKERIRISTTTSDSLWNRQNATETRTPERVYNVEPDELARLGKDLILLYPGGYKRLKKNYYYK